LRSKKKKKKKEKNDAPPASRLRPEIFSKRPRAADRETEP
jgi:hypothetical protein